MSSIKSGQSYRFTNEENKLVLDLSGANSKSILGWNFHGGGNQQWVAEQQDDGQWTLQSVRLKKYLAFEITPPKDGTRLDGLDTPQLWDIEVLPDSEDHDNPRVKLWIRGTLLVVESPREKSDPGPLQLWPAWNGKNQVWMLEETESRYDGVE